MNFKNLSLIGAALLLSAPVFGSTYYAGFEDTKGGDYDYNDIVFSLAGNGLTLNTSAHWYSQPVLNNSNAPFWNNYSYDQPSNAYNVGFCIYGGGACNSGKALDAGAQYLASNATSKTGSANDVTFSASGTVTIDITNRVAGDTNSLGYYLVSDDKIHALTSTSVANVYTFTPGGVFGLVGIDSTTNSVFASQTNLQECDSVSHFAFFNSQAPEPGMMGLVGAGLVGVGAFFRRNKKSAQ